MDDVISRQAAKLKVAKVIWEDGDSCYDFHDKCVDCLDDVPPAQPDIKQAAKLLLDFIESCPGGESYLITPNGEELRTDWGYAAEGIQLILDWAERTEE